MALSGSIGFADHVIPRKNKCPTKTLSRSVNLTGAEPASAEPAGCAIHAHSPPSLAGRGVKTAAENGASLQREAAMPIRK